MDSEGEKKKAKMKLIWVEIVYLIPLYYPFKIC